MLSAVQARKSSPMQVFGLIGLLLCAVFGFLFFNNLHAAHAQESTPSCQEEVTSTPRAIQ